MPRRDPGEPARLFAAAYPPPALSQSLIARASAATPPDARVPALSHIHLTLQFIGDTKPGEIARVIESVGRACAAIPPFTLTFARLRTFPLDGTPRLIAATTDAPSPLLELHRRLATRLSKASSRRQDDRFVPHVTLCRLGSTRPHIDEPLEPFRWEVGSVLLMANDLHPSGSEHREIARVDLIPSTS